MNEFLDYVQEHGMAIVTLAMVAVAETAAVSILLMTLKYLAS